MAKRQCAPLLANGQSRAKLWGRLPPAVKAGLRSIARAEGKSMSWVVEEVVITFFHLRRPIYVKPQRRRARQPARLLRMVR